MLDALQARVGEAHHGGHPVLRLRPAGPEGRAAGADQRQAGRRSDHHRRRLARADGRPARGPDPGLLQRPGRQRLRHPACCCSTCASGSASGDGDGHRARRRRRRARARLRQAARRATSPSSTSAAPAPTRSPRCRSSARSTAARPSSSTTWSTRRARSARRRRRCARPARHLVLACATHAVLSGPGRRAARASPSVDELVVTDTIPLRPEARALDKITRAAGGPAARRGHPTDARRSIRSARCSSEGRSSHGNGRDHDRATRDGDGKGAARKLRRTGQGPGRALRTEADRGARSSVSTHRVRAQARPPRGLASDPPRAAGRTTPSCTSAWSCCARCSATRSPARCCTPTSTRST